MFITNIHILFLYILDLKGLMLSVMLAALMSDLTSIFNAHLICIAILERRRAIDNIFISYFASHFQRFERPDAFGHARGPDE